MMKPKFALSHDFLLVHHKYFVGTSASILLCPPPHFQMSGYATDTAYDVLHHRTAFGCIVCYISSYVTRDYAGSSILGQSVTQILFSFHFIIFCLVSLIFVVEETLKEYNNSDQKI